MKRPGRAPSREFLILFTARTGSSHLADLLTSVGVGDVREWLNPDFMAGQAEYFGSTSLDEYFRCIRSSCPNGIFGQKMTISFYESFSRQARLEDHFDFSAPAVLLFRDNIVEQAVSLHLANTRQHFHKLEGAAASDLVSVPYDSAQIIRYAEALCDEEARLRAFIEDHGCPTRFLSYEQMIEAAPADIVSAIARHAGVVPALDRLKSRHLKLGDAENLAMSERFIEENLLFCDGVHSRRQWLLDGLEQRPLLPA